MLLQLKYKIIIILITLNSCDFQNPYINDETTTKVIELNGKNCVIYLKHVVWGASSDNSITYISDNPKISDTINEPYYRSIDFFYKLDDEKCELIICKADTLNREKNLKIRIKTVEDNFVSFSNYTDNGFENILYK